MATNSLYLESEAAPTQISSLEHDSLAYTRHRFRESLLTLIGAELAVATLGYAVATLVQWQQRDFPGAMDSASKTLAFGSAFVAENILLAAHSAWPNRIRDKFEQIITQADNFPIDSLPALPTEAGHLDRLSYRLHMPNFYSTRD